MAVTLSLQTITERAQTIQRSLTDRFDVPGAKQEAETLYQQGIQLARAEFMGSPLTDDIVSPVVTVLSEVVPLGKTQHQNSFHQSLSKAYRLFIELTWYQCWRQRSIPVFNETRDMIIANTQKIIKVLPSERHYDIRFEYACAKEAANCLTPAESIWVKYVDHLFNIGKAVQTQSIFETLQSARNILKETEKDRSQSWYIDIHHLRWAAANITTQEQFDSIIKPELAYFHEKGKAYTQCLALIYLDFIKNPAVEAELKERAFEGLAELLRLEDHDRASNFLNNVQKKIKTKHIREAAKKEDRYLLTRFLILQALPEILEGNLAQASVLLKGLGSAHKATPHSDEKRAIEAKVSELKDKYADNKQFIEDTEKFLQPTRGDSIEEEEIEKAKEDMKEALEENEQIDLEIKTIESFASALDELSAEEQKLIQELQELASKN